MSLAKFLHDCLPFSLNLLPQDSYLVGGAIRDYLLKRHRDYLDLDFVTPHSAITTAKQIAQLHHAGFVVLDAHRNIARVVFPHCTIDIAQREGKSLEDDLLRRDYTINAIAFDTHKNQIVDPLGGQTDLQKKIIRMICPNNLKDDPLRLLRGYRQGCQLDFTLEVNTQSTIRQLAPLLINVAEERVNSELGYLLRHPQGTFWLKKAYEDQLMTIFFPHLHESHMALLAEIDRVMAYLQNNQYFLTSIPSSWRQLAKLTCFYRKNSAIAEEQLVKLKYSRQEIKVVMTILSQLNCLWSQDFADDLRSQYFFFKSVGDIFPILAIVALAQDVPQELVISLIDRYSNPQDRVAHPQPILTGNNLLQELNLSPSPLIGKILQETQIAYIKGEISNREEAIEWSKQFL